MCSFMAILSFKGHHLITFLTLKILYHQIYQSEDQAKKKHNLNLKVNY